MIQDIERMKKNINKFSIYNPCYSIKKGEDYRSLKDKIQTDLRTKLEGLVVEVDNRFSIENFDYVTTELGSEKIKEIYQLLGPFNYADYQENKEDEGDAEAAASGKGSAYGGFDEQTRVPCYEYEKRKSGAMYRGDVLSESNKPDGQGIKIFNGTSLYEGYFAEGACHGIGRAITTKGDVYQGGFHQDSMEGKGFYVWADGRMYEGEWMANRKHGKGMYFWPNG